MRLAAGAHTLVVRADWRDPAAMKADAWHRTWFNFGGINRPVSIRALGRQRARRAVDRHRLDGTDAVVDVAGRRAQPRRPADDRRARHAGGRCAALRRRSISAAARAPRVRARVRIARPSLWEPGHPTLRRCASRSPARRASPRASACASCAGRGGRLELNGAALEAARRLAAGGRAGPRRRAAPDDDATRSSRGCRPSAPTRRAASTR